MKRLILSLLILFTSTYAHAGFWETLLRTPEIIKDKCSSFFEESQLTREFKNAPSTETIKISSFRDAQLNLIKKNSELTALFKPKDELHAFAGSLFRVRPENSSVALISDETLGLLAESGVIHAVEIGNIQLSWALKHFFPKRPELKSVASHLAGTNSKWSIEKENYIYEVKLKVTPGSGANAGSGAFERRLMGSVESFFFTLKITFAPNRTEFVIDQNEFVTEQAKAFLKELADAQQNKRTATLPYFPLSTVAQLALRGEPLIVYPDTTVAMFENILKVQTGFSMTDKFVLH